MPFRRPNAEQGASRRMRLKIAHGRGRRSARNGTKFNRFLARGDAPGVPSARSPRLFGRGIAFEKSTAGDLMRIWAVLAASCVLGLTAGGCGGSSAPNGGPPPTPSPAQAAAGGGVGKIVGFAFVDSSVT